MRVHGASPTPLLLSAAPICGLSTVHEACGRLRWRLPRTARIPAPVPRQPQYHRRARLLSHTYQTRLLASELNPSPAQVFGASPELPRHRGTLSCQTSDWRLKGRPSGPLSCALCSTPHRRPPFSTSSWRRAAAFRRGQRHRPGGAESGPTRCVSWRVSRQRPCRAQHSLSAPPRPHSRC